MDGPGDPSYVPFHLLIEKSPRHRLLTKSAAQCPSDPANGKLPQSTLATIQLSIHPNLSIIKSSFNETGSKESTNSKFRVAL